MKKVLALLALMLCLALSGCTAQNPLEGIPNPVATIRLTDGRSMRFELFLQDAPNTVANFVYLAQRGHYNGLEFFRVVPGVLAQSGDRGNDGTGHAGYLIQGEFADNGIENAVKHTRGTISMSRHTDDMDSASSQFFILGGSYPEYDGKYAAFGRATDADSLITVDAITNTAVDSSYAPVGNMPRIASVEVETYGYRYTPAKIELPKEETPAEEAPANP